MEKENRLEGIDLVRFIAVLFVPAVHFFLNNGFYSVPLYGKTLFVMIGMRWLFFTCVPLFMLLTGYLQGNKKVGLSHYKKLLPFFISYVFISLVTIFFKIYYEGVQLSPKEWILSITDFTAANYAWYVEMYIGLFLLIPFLNVMYHGLKGKKQKQLLLGIFLLLTSIAPVINHFTAATGEKGQLLPDYWYGLYPFTYYFLGMYLKEFPVKIKKWLNFLLIGFVVALESFLTFFYCHGVYFNWRFLGDYNSFFTVLLTVLLFCFFGDIKIKCKAVRFVIKDVASLSLDIFLVSYIFDTVFYPILNSRVAEVPDKLPYFFVIVPLVLLCSYGFSILKRILFESVKARRLKLFP